MGKETQKILIYTDFSVVGEKSIEWGLFFAERFEKDISIVHVVDENSRSYFGKDRTIEKAKERLEEISQKIASEKNINCEYIVGEGCTCTIINSTAEKIDAFIIIIGVFGKNDMQFLSGTSAGKIIRKSRIPYFVVSKNSISPSLEKSIVLPIDIRKENKEKTGWASYFAKHLPCNIKIMFSDENETNIKNNVNFCTKFFSNLELDYEKVISQKSLTKSIEKRAIKFSKNNDSLFVIILSTKETTLMDKIFGFREDSLIANPDSIPILCINPQKDLYIPCI